MMLNLKQYENVLNYSIEDLKTLEEQQKWLDDGPIEHKEVILNYLKCGEKYLVSSPYEAIDVITGEPYNTWGYGFTDGVYCWGNEVIRYFDKHNIKLKPAFIEHFKAAGGLEQTYKLPELFIYD